MQAPYLAKVKFSTNVLMLRTPSANPVQPSSSEHGELLQKT
jgi:hypothetical protein